MSRDSGQRISFGDDEDDFKPGRPPNTPSFRDVWNLLTENGLASGMSREFRQNTIMLGKKLFFDRSKAKSPEFRERTVTISQQTEIQKSDLDSDKLSGNDEGFYSASHSEDPTPSRSRVGSQLGASSCIFLRRFGK